MDDMADLKEEQQDLNEEFQRNLDVDVADAGIYYYITY